MNRAGGYATILALALLVAGPAPARAGGRWAAELHLGGAWNVSTPLLIRQEGRDDLRFDGRWSTRAFDAPLYYVGRLIARDGGRGWAIDLTHHKLFLTDPPAEVRRFEISHGYNLVTVHRLMERGARRFGVGAGVVVAHPESEVRELGLDERGGLFGSGYHLAGPTLGALAAWLPASRAGAYLTAEARLTLSYARVPVAGGDARVPNAALHLTIGAGWDGAR